MPLLEPTHQELRPGNEETERVAAPSNMSVPGMSLCTVVLSAYSNGDLAGPFLGIPISLALDGRNSELFPVIVGPHEWRPESTIG